jgi:hypothetical protein
MPLPIARRLPAPDIRISINPSTIPVKTGRDFLKQSGMAAAAIAATGAFCFTSLSDAV